MIKLMDNRVAEKERKQAKISPALRAFVDKRLAKVLDLRKLQFDTHSAHLLPEDGQGGGCLRCSVKTKIRDYLQARDARSQPLDPQGYTVDLY